MMRKLCLGGSFNPVHLGHLIPSRFVADAAGFERVVLVPGAVPPHKMRQPDMATAEHRLAMCRLAAESMPGFDVSDLEMRREGASFTIDTARELKRQGWDRVSWLIGADQVPQLRTWREPEALLGEVDFVIMARPGWSLDWQGLPQELQSLRSRVVEAPLLDISSTDIRRRVAAGEPIDHLVPASVARYIAEHRLYRT
jgi:nicotinate-nucleotide adenylyltransferase